MEPSPDQPPPDPDQTPFDPEQLPFGRLGEKLVALIERERPFFSLHALSMYALTLIAELPVILARTFIVMVIAMIIIAIEHHTLATWSSTWVYIALIPTFWSMLALLTPIGSAWWWQIRAGGREPSTREQLAYQDAIEMLQANSDTPLLLPKRWFVLDNPYPDAAVIGNALMLSRGLLETEHLPAVLAHELGHLATPDGRLTAALNRLMIFTSPFRKNIAEDQTQPPAGRRLPGEGFMRLKDIHHQYTGPTDLDPMVDAVYWYLRLLFILSLFARGGLGLWITKPAWGAYWRTREYKADQHAAKLGQAEELATFLEVHALIHDHPVPLLFLTEHTHPPTELRIDRLRAKPDQQHTSAPPTEPTPPDTPPPTA
jgi:Zn-dependent protease with chaperone function